MCVHFTYQNLRVPLKYHNAHHLRHCTYHLQVAQYSTLQLLLSLQCTNIHSAICAHTYVYLID